MGNRGITRARSGRGTVPAEDGKFSLISDEKLIALYAGLLKCRSMNRQPAANWKSGSIRGQEAALVAATIDLGQGDAVCSREHGFLTGFSDGALVADSLLRNGRHPGSLPKRVNAVPTIGTPVNAEDMDFTHAALGMALSHKTKGNRKVAVVFSNKEASERLREAVHIATVHALPMVLVHQSESDGRKASRKAKTLKRKDDAETPWFPHIAVDRDDVVAVYRVAAEAISRARLGRGPTLIECRPFPLNGGTNGRNSRHAHDSIRNMEHYLRARGLFDPKMKSKVLAKIGIKSAAPFTR
jgi:TPP-dependent pyruvate/acetoin dehydrogenase alpha subunit